MRFQKTSFVLDHHPWGTMAAATWFVCFWFLAWSWDRTVVGIRLEIEVFEVLTVPRN